MSNIGLIFYFNPSKNDHLFTYFAIAKGAQFFETLDVIYKRDNARKLQNSSFIYVNFLLISHLHFNAAFVCFHLRFFFFFIKFAFAIRVSISSVLVCCSFVILANID